MKINIFRRNTRSVAEQTEPIAAPSDDGWSKRPDFDANAFRKEQNEKAKREKELRIKKIPTDDPESPNRPYGPSGWY